jgi:thioredoxin-related protein
MERVLVVVVIVAVVGLVALVVQRRRVPDVPTQRRFAAPEQLDRNDFPRPDAPWLVAVFSSATCDVCAQVLTKANVLESADVAVAEIEYSARRDLHERYAIEAVPTLVVADARGVVVATFLGPMTATDLWAAVADAREPGSSPTGGACRRDEPSA